MGTLKDYWEICSGEEENLIIQQFLRFTETRQLAQSMLLVNDALNSFSKSISLNFSKNQLTSPTNLETLKTIQKIEPTSTTTHANLIFSSPVSSHQTLTLSSLSNSSSSSVSPVYDQKLKTNTKEYSNKTSSNEFNIQKLIQKSSTNKLKTNNDENFHNSSNISYPTNLNLGESCNNLPNTSNNFLTVMAAAAAAAAATGLSFPFMLPNLNSLQPNNIQQTKPFWDFKLNLEENKNNHSNWSDSQHLLADHIKKLGSVLNNNNKKPLFLSEQNQNIKDSYNFVDLPSTLNTDSETNLNTANQNKLTNALLSALKPKELPKSPTPHFFDFISPTLNLWSDSKLSNDSNPVSTHSITPPINSNLFNSSDWLSGSAMFQRSKKHHQSKSKSYLNYV